MILYNYSRLRVAATAMSGARDVTASQAPGVFLSPFFYTLLLILYCNIYLQYTVRLHITNNHNYGGTTTTTSTGVTTTATSMMTRRMKRTTEARNADAFRASGMFLLFLFLFITLLMIFFTDRLHYETFVI